MEFHCAKLSQLCIQCNCVIVWIIAIVVENKRTFIMDLCEKEAARLLKMINIGYIITNAIFISTLMVNPANASKSTRDVCVFHIVYNNSVKIRFMFCFVI